MYRLHWHGSSCSYPWTALETSRSGQGAQTASGVSYQRLARIGLLLVRKWWKSCCPMIWMELSHRPSTLVPRPHHHKGKSTRAPLLGTRLSLMALGRQRIRLQQHQPEWSFWLPHGCLRSRRSCMLRTRQCKVISSVSVLQSLLPINRNRLRGMRLSSSSKS